MALWRKKKNKGRKQAEAAPKVRVSAVILAGGSNNKVSAENDRAIAEITVKDSNSNEIRLGNHSFNSVTLEGTSAKNQLFGGDGKDFFLLQFCRGGQNTVRAGGGEDVIIGGNGKDILYGDKGNDLISAGGGNDILYCGDGKDVADGGSGDDTIYADLGDNSLTGGAGRDVFCFGVTKNAKNSICDYESGDVIRFLSNAIFDGYSVTGPDVFLDYMGGSIRLSGARDKLITYQYADGKNGFITETVKFV